MLRPFSSKFSPKQGLKTHHKIQVHVIQPQILQGRVNPLRNAVGPFFLELGSHPNLLAGDAGILDASADFLFVAICERCVDVTVAFLESELDGFVDFVGRALPSSEANGGNLVASVKGEGFSVTDDGGQHHSGAAGGSNGNGNRGRSKPENDEAASTRGTLTM